MLLVSSILFVLNRSDAKPEAWWGVSLLVTPLLSSLTYLTHGDMEYQERSP
jgi:hypothetical protein